MASAFDEVESSSLCFMYLCSKKTQHIHLATCHFGKKIDLFPTEKMTKDCQLSSENVAQNLSSRESGYKMEYLSAQKIAQDCQPPP